MFHGCKYTKNYQYFYIFPFVCKIVNDGLSFNKHMPSDLILLSKHRHLNIVLCYFYTNITLYK